MKLGIFVPIGSLKRFGYQHQARKVLSNLADVADKIAVISSSRENGVKAPIDGKKVIYVSGPESWFEEEGGQEKFSYDVLDANANLGASLLKEIGCDAVAQVHVNQYIPAARRERWRELSQDMLEAKQAYAWLYKRYQLGNLLFEVDVRVPWILNLTLEQPYRFGVDSIQNKVTGERVTSDFGEFREVNDQAVVDVMLNYTREDAKELFLFTHRENLRVANYQDGEAVFNWESWRRYYIHKVRQKDLASDRLDEFGRSLALDRQPNFVSCDFEKRLRWESRTKRWFKRVRRQVFEAEKVRESAR